MSETPVCFLQNPEVLLRDEDEDGGLLFNPVTNKARLLNPTGLFIWKQFASPNHLATVASSLQQEFEEVPADQVIQDIQELVEIMVSAGFLVAVTKPFPT
jgi:hypothetical protein